MNITVSELKQWLSQFDDDMLVVLAHDSEGNEFSPLGDYSTGYYIEESMDVGDFVTDEDLKEEDINVDGAPRAVLLWPAA